MHLKNCLYCSQIRNSTNKVNGTRNRHNTHFVICNNYSKQQYAQTIMKIIKLVFFKFQSENCIPAIGNPLIFVSQQSGKMFLRFYFKFKTRTSNYIINVESIDLFSSQLLSKIFKVFIGIKQKTNVLEFWAKTGVDFLIVSKSFIVHIFKSETQI